jgi:hypothetical protein
VADGRSDPDRWRRPLADGATARVLWRRAGVGVVLAGTVAIAAALRFYGFFWDPGLLFHPDAFNLAAGAVAIDFPDQLEPEFFAYNGLALYVNRLAADTVAALTDASDWAENVGNVVLAGRGVSALFSTATVPVAFLLGRHLRGSWFGCLVALLFAFHAGLVQHAHYATTESALVFFLVAVAAVAAATVRSPERLWRGAAWSGLLIGLALGMKTSALSYLMVPSVAGVVLVRRAGMVALGGAGLLTVALAAGVFAAVSPYSLLDWARFRETMAFERGVVEGSIDVFWTWQFRGAVPYLFEFANLHWLSGPVLPVLGLAGTAMIVVAAARGCDGARAALPLLAFTLVYATYIGSWHAKFIRYLLPMVPMLVVGAAWLIAELCERGRWWRRLGHGVGAVTVASGVTWALAVAGVYGRENTRLAASEWIWSNVPTESTVLIEPYDYLLPVGGASGRGAGLRIEVLPLIDPEPAPEKLTRSAELLAAGDYLILASRRWSGVLSRHPDRFPLASGFHARLRSGMLGYREAARFASYPKLFQLEVPTETAEETFEVFDHPTVIILRNEARLDAAALADRLQMSSSAGWEGRLP